MTAVATATKVCTACKVEKSLDDFGMKKRGKDGRQPVCRPCAVEKTKQWRQANPDKDRAAKRAWAQRNAETQNARRRTEEGKAKQREWAQKHYAEKKIEYIQRGRIVREVEAGAEGFCSIEQLLLRIEYYDGMCAYCRVKPYEHIDHVKPLALGGSGWPSNLRPACAHCNISKNNEHPFEFLARRR